MSTFGAHAATGLTAGATFVIVSNAGSAAVSGTFAGRPEGFAFPADGYWWRVNYTGGNGNDVTLTIVPPPAQPLVASASISSALVQFSITGDSNLAFQVQSSTNLADWTTLHTTNVATPAFGWSDTNTGSFLRRFYRVLLGP